MNTAKLGKIARIDRVSISPDKIKSGTLYLGLEHIESGGTILTTQTVADGELKSSKFMFNSQHLLYGKLRPYLAKIAAPDFDGVCSSDIIPILPGPELDREFLLYFLRQNSMVEYATSRASGANLPRLSPNQLSDFEIPLPPLAEQKRIAAILDTSDALRAKRRQTLAELDTLLQSTFLDMFGDPVTNPKGWRVSTVGDVTDCIVPGRDKPRSFTGSIPWITTDDLVELGLTSCSPKGFGLTIEEIKAVRARIIPSGSVIMSCVGDLGITSVAENDIVVNQQLHSFQCRAAVTPEFIMYCLPFRKAWMKGRATKTTLPYLNKTNCNSIPVTVPPLTLQQKFATIVESVEQQKARLRAHLTELDTLFAALQSRAFKGEL